MTLKPFARGGAASFYQIRGCSPPAAPWIGVLHPIALEFGMLLSGPFTAPERRRHGIRRHQGAQIFGPRDHPPEPAPNSERIAALGVHPFDRRAWPRTEGCSMAAYRREATEIGRCFHRA